MSKEFRIPQTGIGNIQGLGSNSSGQGTPQVDTETQKGQALIKQYLTMQKSPGINQEIQVSTESFKKALVLVEQDMTLSTDQKSLLQKMKSAIGLIAGLDGDDKNVSDLDLTVLSVGDGNSNSLTVQDIQTIETLNQSAISIALPSADDKDALQQGRLVDMAKQGKVTDTTYAGLEKLDSPTLQKNVATAAAQWDTLDDKTKNALGNVFGDLGLTNAKGESTGVSEWIQNNPNTPFSIALKGKLKERWQVGVDGNSAYRNDPVYAKEAGLIEGLLKGQPPNLPAQVDETAAAEAAIRQRRSNAGKNGAFAFLQAQQSGKVKEIPIVYGDRLDATRPKINTDAYLSVFDTDGNGLLNETEFGNAFGKESLSLMKAVDAVDQKIDSQGKKLQVSFADARPLVGFLDAGGFQKDSFLDATITPGDRQAALARAKALQGSGRSKDLVSGMKRFFRKLFGKPASANPLTQVLQNTAALYKIE